MDSEQNSSYIRIRIPIETKKKFKAKCKSKAINFSEWFRQRIDEFVKEDSER